MLPAGNHCELYNDTDKSVQGLEVLLRGLTKYTQRNEKKNE